MHLGLELRLLDEHVEPRKEQLGVLAEQVVRLERVVLADDVLDQDARVRLLVVLEEQRDLALLLLGEVGLRRVRQMRKVRPASEPGSGPGPGSGMAAASAARAASGRQPGPACWRTFFCVSRLKRLTSIFRFTFVLFASNFGLDAPNIGATGGLAFANGGCALANNARCWRMTRRQWMISG